MGGVCLVDFGPGGGCGALQMTRHARKHLAPIDAYYFSQVSQWRRGYGRRKKEGYVREWSGAGEVGEAVLSDVAHCMSVCIVIGCRGRWRRKGDVRCRYACPHPWKF